MNDVWSLFTENAASRYGVDEKLVSAIISVESGRNPTVISRSNAVGLMQIKASTAEREVVLRAGASRPAEQCGTAGAVQKR